MAVVAAVTMPPVLECARGSDKRDESGNGEHGSDSPGDNYDDYGDGRAISLTMLMMMAGGGWPRQKPCLK